MTTSQVVYGINDCNFFTAGNKGYTTYGYAIIRYVNRAGKKSIGVDFRRLGRRLFGRISAVRKDK